MKKILSDICHSPTLQLTASMSLTPAAAAAAADVISSNHFKSKHFLSTPKASGKTLSFLQKASLQLIQLLKKNEYILYDAWQATI